MAVRHGHRVRKTEEAHRQKIKSIKIFICICKERNSERHKEQKIDNIIGEIAVYRKI
jgi:hypothetical protein